MILVKVRDAGMSASAYRILREVYILVDFSVDDHPSILSEIVLRNFFQRDVLLRPTGISGLGRTCDGRPGRFLF